MLMVVAVGVLGSCAGERSGTGLTAGAEVSDAEAGTPYKLEFSAINIPPDGKGHTRVEVKLKIGKVLVSDGKSARARVRLRHLVRNADGGYMLEAFEHGGEGRLSHGTTTFLVPLEPGESYVLRVEAEIDNKQISGQSGVVTVPQEDVLDEEDLP